MEKGKEEATRFQRSKMDSSSVSDKGPGIDS
jgi:hypothetical protein